MIRFCASAIGLEAYEGLQCEGEKLGQFWLHKVRGEAADFNALRAAGVIVMPGLETPAAKIPPTLGAFFSARVDEAEKKGMKPSPLLTTLRKPAADDSVLNLLRAWRDALGGGMDISSEF